MNSKGTSSTSLSSAMDNLLRLSDTDPNKSPRLGNFGIRLLRRFERFYNTTDIDKAILAFSEGLRLTLEGDPERQDHLNNLGVCYRARFRHVSGDVTDINKAISAQEEAVETTPVGHVARPEYLSNLGNSYQSRFERLGAVGDLQKAIAAQKDALQLAPRGHPNRSGYSTNLGISLKSRFEHFRDGADLDAAISAQSHALWPVSESHPKPDHLDNLGNSLLTRFQLLGNVSDLDKAISVQNHAIQLTSQGHSHKPGYLHNLGVSFRTRFEHFGDITDLDKAISVQNEAVQFTAEGHLAKLVRLNSLGGSFQRRFERFGDFRDLDKAISAYEQAVELAQADHPNQSSCLTNLGASYCIRFEHLRDAKDINRAISVQRNTIQLTPESHSAKASHLNHLGNSLYRKYTHFKSPEDLNEAIYAYTSAVDLTPESHRARPHYLNNLGLSHCTHFKHFGDITNLDKAISLQDSAVQLCPKGSPDEITCLQSLGKSLKLRFEHLGDITDLEKAILHFSSAACSSTGPPVSRFKAAVLWARSISYSNTTKLSSSLDAYHKALDLLPHVAWLGLPMVKRHKELANYGDIACDAAAAAITMGEYRTALEWLEQGRSIVWNQLLHLRSPVDELQAKEPALASHLAQVSAQLEHMSYEDSSRELIGEQSLENIGRNHRALALEWDHLVKSVRAIPGFESFLQPRKWQNLKRAAKSGPVVIINAHKDRCDALVLKKDVDEIICIPLRRFSYSQAQKLQQSLWQLLSTAGLQARSERHMNKARPHQDKDSQLYNILSELWSKVVEPVLKTLELTISEAPDPPHIWWCLTGPFVFLPIHAAGFYDRKEHGHKIMDYVTSSYIPTLATLLDTHVPRSEKFHLLTVAQQNTPGSSPLPSTTKEIVQICQHAGKLPITSLEGKAATKENVTKGMKESVWAHLACHGTQNIDDPTSSALLLHDGALKLSEIIQMSLPKADLAFLSACQTATGDQHLSEEAVHLAAGMLLAGYRGVIATMWSINDDDAPIVADKVYAYLFKDQQPDGTRAAYALHHAVQHLREKNVSLLSWVPFIHFGL